MDDAVDNQILQLLSQDGRMSFADLARDTGLSTSALHQRVKRLEQRGVITGYAAKIDPRLVGLALTALISLKPIDPAAPDDIPEKLSDFDEVESCWSVAGEESYILKVRVAEPIELEGLLARLRSTCNVSTKTTVVLSTPFEGRALKFPEVE